MEISRLKKELAEEKKRGCCGYLALGGDLCICGKPKATIVKPAAPSRTSSLVKKRSWRFEEVLGEGGYMVEGLANMLMAATAPAELEKLTKEARLQVCLKRTRRRWRQWRRSSRTWSRRWVLAEENTKLSQASSSKPDADAYKRADCGGGRSEEAAAF